MTGIKFEVNDLKNIGEALEGIVEKMQEQFEVVGFEVHLRYPSYDKGVDLDVTMKSDEDAPYRFSVEVEPVTPEPAKPHEDPTDPEVGVKL